MIRDPSLRASHILRAPADRGSQEPAPATRRRRAFSLIELLVVVGLIAILVALLVPTLGRVRGQSRSVACTSNLRQIGHARIAWEENNDPKKLNTPQWRTELQPYAGSTSQIFYCPEQDQTGESYGYSSGSGTTPTGSGLGAAGVGGSGPGTGTGEATDVATPPAPPPQTQRFMINVRGNNFQIPFDVPFAAGPSASPYIKRHDTSDPNVYRLNFEDWPNGDWDYNDCILTIRQNSDGSIDITPTGGDSGATHDLEDASGKVLIASVNKPSVYKTGMSLHIPGIIPPPSSTPQVGPTHPVNGAGGSSGNGAVTTTSTWSGSGESSYAMNGQHQKVLHNGEKVLALDYSQTIVADPNNDSALWTTGANNRPRFARHMHMINVLYGDGSVRGTAISEIDLTDPANVKRAWEP